MSQIISNNKVSRTGDTMTGDLVTTGLTLTKEATRTISLANSTSANTAGGQLNITGATGTGSGNGGALVITAGAVGANAANSITLASQFTAANDETLSVADNASLSMGAGVRMSQTGWFYRDSNNPVLEHGIVCKGGANPTSLEYNLTFNRVTNLRPTFEVSNGTLNAKVTWGANLSLNTWYFYHVYYDGVNIGISINNGTAVTTAYTGDIQDSTNPLVFGSQGSTNDHDGRIAAVGLWKRVITAAEVTTLYNSGLGLVYAGLSTDIKTSLVSYWNLSESSGNRADSHGTNTLTDINTVTGNPGPSAATGAGGAVTLTTGAGGGTSGNSGSFTIDTGTVTSGTVGSVLLKTGGTERLALSPTGGVFNESGADWDFRIEGDTEVNLFFVDASADKIGIGTNAPLLGDIHLGSANNVKQIRLGNTTTPGFLFISESGGILELSSARDGTAGTFPNTGIASAAIQLVSASLDSKIVFKTTATNNANGSTRMTLDKNGDLGIGAVSSGARLHVQDATNAQISFQSENTGDSGSTVLLFKNSAGTNVGAFGYGHTARTDLFADRVHLSGAGSKSVTIAADVAGGSIIFAAGGGAVANEVMSMAAGAIIVNDTGADIDFRGESDDATNLWEFDAGADTGAGAIGFFSVTPQVQQATIADADGTLADITTKFNTLLADLEGYGLLKSA